MATKKKTTITKKRSISSGQARSYSDLYKDDKTRSVQVTTPVQRTPTLQETPATVQTLNWREEYAHVIRDLRTLLIVSAILFAIIIITGFFV